MVTAQQLGGIQLGAAQAPTLSLQAGAVPAVVGQQLDINSIFNLMIMLVVVMMMMKMMRGVTEQV